MVYCFPTNISLISTDAAARGIDIANIDCVVSYEVPRVLTTYVHRVGRTARAARLGTAITLLERPEVLPMKRLSHKHRQTFS